MEEFARRLADRMAARGLNQSDVARAVWGEREDARGYTVARNRDRVSSYLSGRSLPDPANLRKLAEALETTPEDLAPEITGATVERENPELAMTAIAGHHDKVLLRVNKLLPLQLAAKIIGLISEHDAQ